MSVIHVPVAIVGGGEVGLTTSILLSKQGIQHVLFEKNPGTAIYPKALGLQIRSMEIMRRASAEMEAEMYAASAPPENCQITSWYTSFGAQNNDDKWGRIWGREIASRKGFGYVLDDGERGAAYKQASPNRPANIAQLRLEPILRRKAEELNPKGIFFHHEVEAVEEQGEFAELTYHARSGPTANVKQTLRATYVIGADGGRALTDKFGGGWEGESEIAEMLTAHIRAPLSQHVPDSRVQIYWFVNPRQGGSVKSGVAYPLGPYPSDPKTEEWTVFIARMPQELHKKFTEEDMMERLKAIFRIPELPIELLSMSPWSIQARHASRYVSPGGRVFLVGDAAHRIPPWGGIGGNTGIQDADNLVWKLAWALKSDGKWDPTGLLASYDSERRRVGNLVATNSVKNFRAHGGVFDRALGLSPECSEEDNMRAMSLYLDGDEDGGEARKAARDTVRKAVHEAANETLDTEFYALGLEAGICYDHSAVTENETWASPQMTAEGSFDISDYHQCTMPGHQLPHLWLTNSSGTRTSTRYLAKPEKFLLLTASASWTGIEHPYVDVIVVNESSEWRDAEGKWETAMEVGLSGAVLVRPDSIVAYRWKSSEMLEHHPDPNAEMKRVLKKVLWVPEESV